MRDVAAKAGVSATVVSHVLSGGCSSVRVSETTAQRVRNVADDLGYRLNVTAKQFRQRQTMMIGVLHGVGFGRPHLHGNSQYFAALMDGIIDGAFIHGYSVTLCPKLLGQRPEDAMTDGRFDGLVWYSTTLSEENRRIIDRSSVPIVLIHTPPSEFEGRFPTVMCDNDQGIALAVDHLVSLGHRRIAFAFREEEVFGELAPRRHAFVRHLKRNGIEPADEDIIALQVDSLERSFDRFRRYTGLVTVNDGAASLVLDYAERAGFPIPDKLSVVGFDSTPFCLGLRPRLTSVFQPLAAMGRYASDLLVKSIRDETPDPFNIVLPCSLDLRDSTMSLAST